MRWIEKLANENFKDMHFEELFNSIGLKYNPKKEYTVQELIDLKLDDFADVIIKIFKSSNNELLQLQQLNAIVDLWTSKIRFKLAKNFPMKLYKFSNFDLQTASASIENKMIPRSSKIKELREISSQQIDEQTKLIKNVSYKLVDINEIRFFAEDSFIKLDIIVQSKITKETREECLALKMKINQILKLTEIWYDVQNKVN